MDSLNLSPNQNNQSDDVSYETIASARSGANWFYWIAALSVVNSLIFLFGGNWSFFAGLGITQIIDAIVLQVTQSGDFSAVKIISFVIDLAIAALFAGFGYFANRLQSWAFILGMILYLLDGLLLLVLGAYFPAGFHVFALVMIYLGFSAARKVNAATKTL